MLVAGLDVQVLGLDGSPLRHLTLDPSVDYRLFGFWRGVLLPRITPTATKVLQA